MIDYELYHHGILGMHWGIRRYQNPDGSLTPLGRKRLEKKDSKWAKKNYEKIYRKAYKQSKDELNDYLQNDLSRRMSPKNESGKLSLSFVNEYNREMARIMNTHVPNMPAPSGRVVKFVAKRGEVGVHLALADAEYDISQLKNGVFKSGKIAYRSKNVDMV